jgi:hypothetical protein
MLTEQFKEPQDLQTVIAAFDEWRRSRAKREAIPEHLWQAATALSPLYATHRIARALKLDYSRLKLRIGESSSRGSGSDFIELRAASLFAQDQCTIELQSPTGFQMMIRAQGTSPAQFVPIITAFLGERR